MTLKLVAIFAGASLIGFPALAQITTVGPALALPPPPETLQPISIQPASPADLTPGAQVVDPDGVALGHVVEVSKPKPRQQLQSFVFLEEDGVTVALPMSSITLADGALTARESRAEVWGPQ